MTPYHDLWLKCFPGGTVPNGVMAKALKPLHDQHGPEVVCQHLGRYLKETGAQYINLLKFAQTFPQWAPAKAQASGLGFGDDDFFKG